MFNFFSSPDDVEIDGLGRFKYSNQEWGSEVLIDEMQVEITIDSSKKKPDSFGVNYLIGIKAQLSSLWKSAIEYSIVELSNLDAPFSATNTDFTLKSISIHKENSFDNGHLVFWFDITNDPNGTYYVSFIEEKPSYLHRDS